MTTIPTDVVGGVGREYFAQRFGTKRAGPSEKNREGLIDLPLEHRTVDRISANGAVIEIQGDHVPLFQPVVEVGGAELWRAYSDGRRLTAAAIDGGSVVLGFDPWVAMGAALLGFAMSSESAYASTIRDGPIPWVDKFATALAETLSAAGCDLSPRRPWAGGAPFALCLTHDVDRTAKTFQYLTHIGRKNGLPSARRRRGLRTRPYWGFDAIRDIEGRANVHSTFFMLHEGPEAKRGLRNRILAWGLADFKDPEVASVVRSLSHDGCEIGLHASLSSTESRQRLALEKHELESVLDGTVNGVRQHHLRLRLPNRWEEFADTGFQYDASFGFRETWGFRAGTAFPYRLAGTRGLLPIEEISLQIMDSTLERYDDPWGECVRALDAVESVGGILTVLFHQRYFDERNFPGYAELYESLIAEAKRRGAWIATAGEVAGAWLH